MRPKPNGDAPLTPEEHYAAEERRNTYRARIEREEEAMEARRVPILPLKPYDRAVIDQEIEAGRQRWIERYNQKAVGS